MSNNRDRKMDFPTVRITEGTTNLYVPDLSYYKENESDFLPTKAPIFYNPKMEFSRDLSVVILRLILKEPSAICDLLSSTGVRAIRYANETPLNHTVYANDGNKYSKEIIEKNRELNNLKNVIVSNDGANSYLIANRSKFDVIDIDPYGSPVNFIENSLRALKKVGYLFITATDTATLCGVYPKTCQRRYGTHVARTQWIHELAVRILIGFVINISGRMNRSARPIFSYAKEHYFRIYFKIEKGIKKAEDAVNAVAILEYCSNCLGVRLLHTTSCSCPNSSKSLLGPLYIGNLYDKTLLENIRSQIDQSEFTSSKRIKKMIELILDGDVLDIVGAYDLHQIAKKEKGSSIKNITSTINELRTEGYKAGRTHFNVNAIKTDADVKKIMDLK